MKFKRFGARTGRLGVLFVLAALTAPLRGTEKGRDVKYPDAPKSETVDVYHGTKIADPYRPLEDPDAPATVAWVKAENEVAFEFLESIAERPAIRARLTELWDYEKFGVPSLEGGRLFFTHNSGLQNQSVLLSADGPSGEATPLLDPNTLS